MLAVDVSNRRISLGLKQIERNPWEVIGEKFPIGTIIEGQVKNITDFGFLSALTTAFTVGCIARIFLDQAHQAACKLFD